MGTKHGKYSTDDLGRDGTGPLKVTEMDRERTRPKTVADGVSFADLIDRNSKGDAGLSASIKSKR